MYCSNDHENTGQETISTLLTCLECRGLVMFPSIARHSWWWGCGCSLRWQGSELCWVVSGHRTQKGSWRVSVLDMNYSNPYWWLDLKRLNDENIQGYSSHPSEIWSSWWKKLWVSNRQANPLTYIYRVPLGRHLSLRCWLWHSCFVWNWKTPCKTWNKLITLSNIVWWRFLLIYFGNFLRMKKENISIR